MAQWDYTLNVKDIWNDFEEMGFENARDAIVEKIRTSRFWDEADFILGEIVECLEFSANLSAFNSYWNDFYDWADATRVWVETF